MREGGRGARQQNSGRSLFAHSSRDALRPACQKLNRRGRPLLALSVPLTRWRTRTTRVPVNDSGPWRANASRAARWRRRSHCTFRSLCLRTERAVLVTRYEHGLSSRARSAAAAARHHHRAGAGSVASVDTTHQNAIARHHHRRRVRAGVQSGAAVARPGHRPRARRRQAPLCVCMRKDASQTRSCAQLSFFNVCLIRKSHLKKSTPRSRCPHAKRLIPPPHTHTHAHTHSLSFSQRRWRVRQPVGQLVQAKTGKNESKQHPPDADADCEVPCRLVEPERQAAPAGV